MPQTAIAFSDGAAEGWMTGFWAESEAAAAALFGITKSVAQASAPKTTARQIRFMRSSKRNGRENVLRRRDALGLRERDRLVQPTLRETQRKGNLAARSIRWGAADGSIVQTIDRLSACRGARVAVPGGRFPRGACNLALATIMLGRLSKSTPRA